MQEEEKQKTKKKQFMLIGRVFIHFQFLQLKKEKSLVQLLFQFIVQLQFHLEAKAKS